MGTLCTGHTPGARAWLPSTDRCPCPFFVTLLVCVQVAWRCKICGVSAADMSGARAHVAEKHRRTYADWLRVWLRANPQAAGAGGYIPDRDLVLLSTLDYALLPFLMPLAWGIYVYWGYCIAACPGTPPPRIHSPPPPPRLLIHSPPPSPLHACYTQRHLLCAPPPAPPRHTHTSPSICPHACHILRLRPPTTLPSQPPLCTIRTQQQQQHAYSCTSPPNPICSHAMQVPARMPVPPLVHPVLALAPEQEQEQELALALALGLPVVTLVGPRRRRVARRNVKGQRQQQPPGQQRGPPRIR